MYLHCSPCDVRQRNCRDWYKHLNSERHQDVAKDSVNNCSTEMSYRSIVCSDFNKEIMKSLMLDEYNLVTYFGSFGLVHDIYFKRDGGGGGGHVTACLVLMDSVELVKAIMNEWKNVYRVDTQQFKAIIGNIQRRCDMSGFAFQKLMEDAAEEVFLRRHEELVRICAKLPLEEQFYEWVSATRLSHEDIRKREGFLKELEMLMKQEFPNSKCQPFGSYLIGFSDRDADLDVFVDVGVTLKSKKSESGGIETSESEDSLTLDEVFDRILKHIRRNNKIQHPESRRTSRRFKSIIPIPARVPIIRLIHEETQLHCDLSFASRISVINSNLMRFYNCYDHRVRPLMAFLRYWGRFHSLLGSNKIKTYALMLMAVVFLNQEQVLPGIYYLQKILEYKKSQFMVDGWKAGFADDVHAVRQSIADTGRATKPLDFYESELSCKDILELAKGFFKMFGAFDFESFVVCPAIGSQIDKMIFHNQDAFVSAGFPGEYEKLKEFRYTAPMCVQDPFVLNFNVTNNITIKLLKRFTSLCRETCMFLDRVLQANADQRGCNLFADIFFNVEDLLSKKPNEGRPQIHHPIADSEEVMFLSVPVNQTQHVVKQQSIKDFEPATTPTESNTSSKFAMDVTMAEANNFEETDETDSILPIPKGLVPPYLETFTYSLEHSISTEFKQLFMLVLLSLDDVIEVENRMKIAWTLFMTDFFQHIFDKGFGLKTIVARKLPFQPIENFNVEEVRARKELGLDDCLPYTVTISLDKKAGLFVIGAHNKLKSNNGSTSTLSTSSPTSTSSSSRKRKLIPPSHLEQNDSEMADLNKRGRDDEVKVEEILEDFTQDETDICNFVSDDKHNPFDLPTASHPHHQFLANPKFTQRQNQTHTNGDDESTEQNMATFSIPVMTKETYSKIPAGFRKPFSTEFEIEGFADGFIGRERRNFERALSAQKSEILNVNPITLEESATKSFKGVNSVKAESRKRVHFFCTISVDTFAPQAMTHFREILDPPAKFPVVHLIRDTGFSQMFHHYTMFRLKKMLSKTNSN